MYLHLHHDGNLPCKEALNVGVRSEGFREASVRHQKGRSLSLWLLTEPQHFKSCPTQNDNYPPPFKVKKLQLYSPPPQHFSLRRKCFVVSEFLEDKKKTYPEIIINFHCDLWLIIPPVVTAFLDGRSEWLMT